MQENDKLNPEEPQVSKLNTVPVNAEELEDEELTMKDVEDVSGASEEELKAQLEETMAEFQAEDLNKKNYLKISPTFYVQAVETEEELEDGEEKTELFKILNPKTQEVETRELTDEEKKEIYVLELKKSKQRFQPIKHNGNKTINQFDAKYKAKRQRRNKLAKASRKANR